MAALLEETNIDTDNTVGRCSSSFIIDAINSSILLLKPGKSGGLSGCSSYHVITGTTLFNVTISRGFAVIDVRLSTLVPNPKK